MRLDFSNASQTMEGNRTYAAYAGDEPLKTESNQLLTQAKLDLVYGQILADPVIDFSQKSLILTTALIASGADEETIAFHRRAMARHGHDAEAMDKALQVGMMLQDEGAQNLDSRQAFWKIYGDPEAENKGDLVKNEETFAMAKITALASMGPSYRGNAKEALAEYNGLLGQEKTVYAINLSIITKGTEAADRATVALKEIMEGNPGYGQKPHRHLKVVRNGL